MRLRNRLSLPKKLPDDSLEMMLVKPHSAKGDLPPSAMHRRQLSMSDLSTAAAFPAILQTYTADTGMDVGAGREIVFPLAPPNQDLSTGHNNYKNGLESAIKRNPKFNIATNSTPTFTKISMYSRASSATTSSLAASPNKKNSIEEKAKPEAFIPSKQDAATAISVEARPLELNHDKQQQQRQPQQQNQTLQGHQEQREESLLEEAHDNVDIECVKFDKRDCDSVVSSALKVDTKKNKPSYSVVPMSRGASRRSEISEIVEELIAPSSSELDDDLEKSRKQVFPPRQVTWGVNTIREATPPLCSHSTSTSAHSGSTEPIARQVGSKDDDDMFALSIKEIHQQIMAFNEDDGSGSSSNTPQSSHQEESGFCYYSLMAETCDEFQPDSFDEYTTDTLRSGSFRSDNSSSLIEGRNSTSGRLTFSFSGERVDVDSDGDAASRNSWKGTRRKEVTEKDDDIENDEFGALIPVQMLDL